MSIAEKLTTIAENMQSVYDKGYADSEEKNKLLWENALSINSMYDSVTFPDNTIIEMNLPNVTNLQNAFRGTKNVEKISLKGNINGEIVNIYQSFRFSTVKIIDMSQFNIVAGACTNAFANASNLVTILGVFDLSSATAISTMFGNCSSLKNVRFVEKSIKQSISFEYSSELSNESIQSIIDGLADLTGETTQTISFHSSVLDRLTEDQITTITLKNWTIN